MKEKNKKFKFKKWYLMPIFVFTFLCVFGFSIVKPVKAQYSTFNPTYLANTQYAFDTQLEISGEDYTFMLPSELYNYTQSSEEYSLFIGIDDFDNVEGVPVNMGYIEQKHSFISSDSGVYDYLLYYSTYHFNPIFSTRYDTYMNFVANDFVFIPSGANGYSNFSFTSIPYFNAGIHIEKDLNNNQYLKLINCEFDVVYLTIGQNGVEEVVVPYIYDFQEEISNTYDNVDLYYTWNGENYDIVNVDNEFNRIGAYFYPYRLVDYLLRESIFFHTQNMLLIRNFKIFTYIAPRTQVTGNDGFFTFNTPVTKQSDIPFDSIDYKTDNYSIELLNANITPSQWGQIQFDRIGKHIVDTDVDMTSWLISAVGAFMNAELFPGFAIGGIFAVIVAFPLVIWFLKIVLGG